MTDLYKTTPKLPRPSPMEEVKLMAEAEDSRSWEVLKPYPMLLYFYQMRHGAEMMNIAKWVSHFRTNKHKWCKHKS